MFPHFKKFLMKNYLFRSVFKKRTGVDQIIVSLVMFAMVEYAAIVITDFDYIYTRKVIYPKSAMKFHISAIIILFILQSLILHI